MRKIIAGALTWREASYHSPEEAIAAVKRRDGLIRLFEGPAVDCVLGHDTGVRLCLDNGDMIDIRCRDDGVVDYTVHTAPGPEFRYDRTIEDSILIEFPDLTYIWDRKGLIGGLKERKLRALVTRPGSILLYADRVEPILFSAVLDKGAGKPFLFWAPAN